MRITHIAHSDNALAECKRGAVSIKNREEEQKKKIRKKDIMKQTLTIPETFLGVGYTRDRAGLPLEAVRVPVPQPGADQVLIRVAASSLNPLEYKLAELNFLGRTPPRRPGPRPVRIRGGERQRGARCNRWRRSGGDGG